MNQTIASPSPAASPSPPANWGAADTARSAATPTQFISFAIGDDQYGVDIMAVREIKGWSEITHLPKQPEYVRGVLNLRGVIVPIIDLRCRFGQGVTEATPLHIVIIVQVGSVTLGRGKPLLPRRITNPPLRLVSVDQVGSGFAELRYEVVGPTPAAPSVRPVRPSTRRRF